MVRRIAPPGTRALAGPASGIVVPAGAIASPPVAVAGDDKVALSNRTATMIDIAQVQGQVHAMSVQKVGELADKNPHETVSIIRGWLHENAA
jgi:flagellar M-ring protein FliF